MKRAARSRAWTLSLTATHHSPFTLQGLMDEVDLGEIEDDEARGAARLRRKAINARVEAELEPAAQALKVHVKAQASRVA